MIKGHGEVCSKCKYLAEKFFRMRNPHRENRQAKTELLPYCIHPGHLTFLTFGSGLHCKDFMEVPEFSISSTVDLPLIRMPMRVQGKLLLVEYLPNFIKITGTEGEQNITKLRLNLQEAKELADLLHNIIRVVKDTTTTDREPK